MPCIALLVAPGLPHDATQRGGRRQTTFFGEDDYRLYRIAAGGARQGGGAV